MKPLRPSSSRRGLAADLRIGFVPLLDAAPLIAALELGLFADEGLNVSLHRQIGWANIRDKLAFGALDAGHALLGLPLASHLDPAFPQPLVAIMALGLGGNAITLSNELLDAGVRTATDLGQLIRRHKNDRRLVFGHVFASSMHHYLLREFLSSGGIDPDRDVRLAVIPPPQMPQHMAGGHVDGFCVGEPWNAIATRAKVGRTLLATTDLLPDHPEKVLAVTARFLADHGELLERALRAILHGCAFAAAPANRRALAEILARPCYINQPAEVLFECLAPERTFLARQSPSRVFSFDPQGTFPSKTYFHWLAGQMQRWGHLPADTDVAALADQACDTRIYRAAAADLGLACPAHDRPPMSSRNQANFAAIPASAVNASTSWQVPQPTRSRPRLKPVCAVLSGRN